MMIMKNEVSDIEIIVESMFTSYLIHWQRYNK